MHEWNMTAEPIDLTPDDVPAMPAALCRPHIIRRFRRLPRWQQWIVLTMIWAGLAVLIIQTATRGSNAPGAIYSALALAAILVIHTIVLIVAWRTGRLS